MQFVLVLHGRDVAPRTCTTALPVCPTAIDMCFWAMTTCISSHSTQKGMGATRHMLADTQKGSLAMLCKKGKEQCCSISNQAAART